MRDAPQDTAIAGYAAMMAGIAWVIWSFLNTRTHGGLDAGSVAVGDRFARLGQLLMVAWNLLLIPVALALFDHLVSERPARVRVATVCGLASLFFWAYGGATHGITPSLEVSYLALSCVWWCGVGSVAWTSNRWFGGLTLALGVFAGWDAVLTACEPVPFGLYLTAAPKLPLSILWDFAVGFVLLRRVPLVSSMAPSPA
jgi:hypothetical protein